METKVYVDKIIDKLSGKTLKTENLQGWLVSPEIEPSTYGIECIIKVASQITEEQVNLTVISVGKKRKLDLFLNPYITNSKWIRKLTIQNKHLQILDENIGVFLHKLGIENIF